MAFPIKQEFMETNPVEDGSTIVCDGVSNKLPKRFRNASKKQLKVEKISDLDSESDDHAVSSGDEYAMPLPKKKVMKKKPDNQLESKKVTKVKVKSETKVSKINKKSSDNSVEGKKPIKKEKVAKVKKEPKVSKRSIENPERPSKKRKVMKNEVKEDEIAEEGFQSDPETSAAFTEEADSALDRSIEQAKLKAELWRDEDVISEITNVPFHVAENVIKLLNQDCTIPFIVRYRKEMVGGLQAEKVRDIQTAYEEVKQVHKKVTHILKTLNNKENFEKTAIELLSAKTLDEVELLYAPFKPGGKRTLAEKSKKLGLEAISLQLLSGQVSLSTINVDSYLKPDEGLESTEKVLEGIRYIIADAVAKDRKVLDFVQQRSQHHSIHILSTKSAAAEKKDKQAHVEGKKTENFKYENYFQSNFSLNNIAPHQVMALNRGEKQKVLTVKVSIPSHLKQTITNFCWNTFFYRKYLDQNTFKFLKDCMEDSYCRLIEPYMCRLIRSKLSKNAEKESIAVFCSNVKSLLLTPPVRGKTVIGIDPGFSHGCKVAVISPKGDVMQTDVLYIHPSNKHKNRNSCTAEAASKLKLMISTFGAEILAIGNGTACRETETWLSDLNNANYFSPVKVKYCIINESGVSIWSVTKEAEAELPSMDANLRSAVSIARRLQDPLLEYVKVEPKHLGVGSYQHDISEAMLKKALDSVVEECVSFVGVDLNVCPEIMLRKISGLSTARAKQIVAWRTQKGCFINRQQLLKIKGLGPKSFEQCAGFVKIFSETCLSDSSSSNSKVFNLNPLDQTIIHPESYEVAEKFLNELKASPLEIGKQTLASKVKSYMQFTSVEDVAKRFDISASSMQLIVDAFQQLHGYDIRGELKQPLFMTSVQKITDLKEQQILTGRVSNMTAFGAFVDIGVGHNGLIHTSQMRGMKLSVGDRVRVKVLSIKLENKRIGLQLCDII